MKTRNKKVALLMVLSLMVLTFAGCGKENENAQNHADTTQTEAPADTDVDADVDTDANAETIDAADEPSEAVVSDGYEKFSQLQIGMTEAEVNAILGEPVRIDKAYYFYNIVVNGQDMELEVWINTTSGQVTYIRGDFGADEYRAEFMDNATDLSGVDGLDSGEIATYDDCVSTFKTEGYLMSVDEDGEKQYLWVDQYDGYMRITFKADGTVKKYNGFC